MSTLGFSHVCLTTLSPGKAQLALEGQGYSCRFKYEGLPIPPQKAPFLRRPAYSNELVFLSHPEAPALELVFHHATESGVCGPYALLLPPLGLGAAGESPEDFWTKHFEMGTKEAVQAMNIAGLGIRTHHFRTKLGLNMSRGLAACACGDLGSAKNFWIEGLGFRETERTGNDYLALLRFLSPVPAWTLNLLLVEVPNGSHEPTFIDDDGLTCISFLVGDIDRSLRKLGDCGARDLGSPFQVEVGGKQLAIAFVRGPWNELIELLQLN